MRSKVARSVAVSAVRHFSLTSIFASGFSRNITDGGWAVASDRRLAGERGRGPWHSSAEADIIRPRAGLHPSMTRRLHLVAGARPNFMKLAPVVRALADQARLRYRIVHTGQHYGSEMSDVFFQELGIPSPTAYLEVGSGSQGAQTARILERYEQLLLSDRPDATVVFGDVNSTVACSLAASKLCVPVAHVEAGLRSFDRTMPEEINRILTDAMAGLLLVSEPSGMVNLTREGVAASSARLVGNVMIDTLLLQLPAARGRETPRHLGLREREYGVVTLHRPSNVDDAAVLGGLVELLHELAQDLPLVFPLHPRTLHSARKSGLEGRLAPGHPRLVCVPPQPYLDMLALTAGARVVLTDSGGVQEETSVLRVPCLTLRPNTERPITIERGTNRLVGNEPARIRAAFQQVLRGDWPRGEDIPLWDGQAGVRVAGELASWLGV
jgi:UDP-N-acetylglucosamine 2-epimerase (non-hydrolysing)